MVKRLAILFVFAAVALPTANLRAGDGIDIDLWHEVLNETLGEDAEEMPEPPSFGIYPTLGVALGPPNWASLQGSVYLSYSSSKFSIYGGYGVERGATADARIITLGWGGVTAIPVASKQKGFHGKFLRYRRWDEEDHGVHHGLSFGTDHGIGFGSLSLEIGAARSQQNHWMVTLEIALKFAAPIRIPLTKKPVDQPDAG